MTSGKRKGGSMILSDREPPCRFLQSGSCLFTYSTHLFLRRDRITPVPFWGGTTPAPSALCYGALDPHCCGARRLLRFQLPMQLSLGRFLIYPRAPAGRVGGIPRTSRLLTYGSGYVVTGVPVGKEFHHRLHPRRYAVSSVPSVPPVPAQLLAAVARNPPVRASEVGYCRVR